MNLRSKKSRREFLHTVYSELFDLYGELHCTLDFRNALELLVATILSAQCTDERVNKITPALFEKYPDADAYADAFQLDLEDDIRTAGFFRNKAKSIIGAAKKIVTDYNGTVPDSMTELVKLPGVGRKTANVILGDAFEIPGFPVDTHVIRLLNRLGYVKSDNAVIIERKVIELLEAQYWTNFSHMLIQHGRRICKARTPDCPQCVLQKNCKYFQSRSSVF